VTRLPRALFTISGLFVVVAALAGCEAESAPATPAVGTLSGVDPSVLSALDWRSVGPHRGGRSIAVVGDSKDPLVFYFGSTHGGVWKTEDAGTYWRNVSDGFFKKSPVGAIDVSLSNPSIIYVGMGESLTRQDISPGDGVYKSIDGGATWAQVGLAETRHIAKVRIHPTNPDIAYVAAAGDIFGNNPDRGVFRTKDGGKTWQKVLFKGDHVGALDLVMDPANPAVLYASLNQLQRLPWDQASGGPDSGLYKTTDGGDTWTDITHRPGMPKGIVGKIGLAVSPVRPSRVWALVEAEEGGLYRSDDSGQNWQAVNHNRNLWRSAPSYMHVIADQADVETVWLPAYDFLKSTDGGKTFTSLPMPHGDHHALWIDPKNPRRMIEGSDGGATITLNGGATWSSQHNQPTAELFGLAIDDQVPYRLYAAQNDNTHIATPSRTDDGAIAFRDNEGLPPGEGGETAVTPDGNIVYGADRAGIDRYDRRTGQATTVSVWPDDQFTFVPKDVTHRFYYTLPLVLSPHDPKVLYTAGNKVFRTTDQGNSWEAISPDVSKNRQDKLSKMPGGALSSQWSSLYWVSLAQSLAESRLEKGELWVGMDDSTVQMTKDAGKTWQDVSPKDFKEWTTTAAIEVSPHARGTAYLAAHRYKVSDLTPYFYKTTDYGSTWTAITNGIRAQDFARTIREDPVRPGLLYAGTDSGVYVSFDAGANWQSLQRSLPAVSAQYMQVKNNDLVVATHGRGFWIMDNLSALRQVTAETLAAPAHLFEIASTPRYLPVRVLSPNRPFRPGVQFANASDTVVYEDRQMPNGRIKRFFLNGGENPPSGVVIEYHLKDAAPDGATLTILDKENHNIAQFSGRAKDGTWMPADKGMNRFVWDMRYPGASEIPPPPGILPAEYGRVQPPTAPPGRYIARLSIGGRDYQRDFEIKRDARLTATDEDLRAQFDLLIQIRDRTNEITEAVGRLRKARSAATGGADAGVQEKLTAIENTLTRLPGRIPMVLPPKALNNRLAALSSEVAKADARPTKPMYGVFQELSAAVAEQLKQLNAIVPKDANTSAGGK
jgi:photosystem II stability/assembly factor-like uncharacterized protein